MRMMRLAFNAGAAVLAITPFLQSALAQEAETPETVTVTGSHIVRDGYQAPTPLTVLGADDLKAAAPANIADAVTKLPSVVGSTTNQNSNQGYSGGVVGIVSMNLRNLGANRTLVLLDGQRSVPAAVTGIVDVNTMPQELISRVDVVTGGASAVYGSDALAGVVNFVLDKDYTGLKGELSGGITTYGDDASYRMSVTAGTAFAGGRGHLLLNASTDHTDGIYGAPRKWDTTGKYFLANPNYSATTANGQPQYLIVSGAGFATATPGGIITGNPAGTVAGSANALKGIAFGPGGTPYQFNYGSLTSNPFCVGGDCTANQGNQGVTLDQGTKRGNVFGRVSYELTDHISVFLQGSFSQATSHGWDVSTFSFANQLIQTDNAFLPATVKARAQALGISNFTMGTFWADLPPLQFIGVRDTTRAVAGGNGDFDLFGSNWKWNIYGQLGYNSTFENGYAQRTSFAKLAIDAVVNPATGAIVCRSTLTSPNNGCVPYDIFGSGVNTQKAINYVDGAGTLSYRHQMFSEKVLSGSVTGEPFSDWAGPVSVALGIEHRRDAVNGFADAASAAHDWFAGNYLPTVGSFTVTEGFIETVVPIAEDVAWAKSLDLNLAYRETDYSTSGMVDTFKIGVEYAPMDDFRIRATRSRDIRAPNLSELYAAGTSGTNNVTDPKIIDPVSHQPATYVDLTITAGNPNLKPEVATTNSVGVVLTPSFLPGFSASVDYYNIHIRGGVGSLNQTQIVNYCEQGITTYCSAIDRNPVANPGEPVGRITIVHTTPFNLASQIADGLDMEASFTGDIADYVADWNGNFTIRALATHYMKNYSNSGTGIITDTVGQNQNVSGNTSFGPPNWVYNAMLTYTTGPYTGTFSARGISSGVYANANISLVGCGYSCPLSTTNAPTVNDTHVPGSFYLDASFNYTFGPAEFFFAVKNIMDRDPPIVAPGTGVPNITQTNLSLYDILGRTYRAGIRFDL